MSVLCPFCGASFEGTSTQRVFERPSCGNKCTARPLRRQLDRVRVMYDDFGWFLTFDFDNARELGEKGIPCVPFNPLLVLKGTGNHRDHRKMLIVGNEIAYSVGINLVDCYINLQRRHGHWKDIGFRLTGEPVHSFSHMFMTFWGAFARVQGYEDLPTPDLLHGASELSLARDCAVAPRTSATAMGFVAPPRETDGYVLSYYDLPLNREATSNQLYIDLLFQSIGYAWFFTPYLMLADDLRVAARTGVACELSERGVS